MDEINGLTPAEFAAKIKEKYPQYKDVEDSILVEKMLVKYPQYRDKIVSANKPPVQPEEAAVPPKGEKAEVIDSGVLDSPSAEKTSSSESNLPQSNDDPFFRANNRELLKERDSLQATIASRPVMFNNAKEDARLAEINKSIEELSSPKKSYRKIANEKIAEIDKKQDELTTKAVQISKGTKFGVDEILNSDGTYQDLLRQRQDLMKSTLLAETLLKRVKEDTNSDQSNFFGKIAKTFGIGDEEVTQTIHLNDAVEEQILLNLEGDKRTKEKIANGYSTLNEKEALIANAKVTVIKNEKNKILEEAKAARETITDKALLNNELQKLDNRFNALLGEVGFDQANSILKNNFRKTDESQAFDELVSSDGFLHTTADSVLSLFEGVVQTAFKGTVGFTADVMAGISDVAKDDDSYSVFDAFSDSVNAIGNYNFLPSSQKDNTRLVTDAGDLNLSYKTVTKSLAQTLPFTLAIINDARRGKITNVEVAVGKLLNPTKSAKMTQSLRLIDSAFRHTLSDNINMAESLGLSDNEGRIFASTMSLTEGMAELIMPDTNFFKSQVGDALRRNFIGTLKGAVNKKAASQAVSNFVKNVALEIGEEEVVLAMEDIMKYSMVVGHENSEFWDLKNQKELVAATVIMSGTLGGAGMRGDFRGNKMDLYRKVSTDINGVTEGLRAELETDIHSPEEKKGIEKAIEWANNMHKAVQLSPKDVTGRDIDLLMYKAELVQEMKTLDPAFHAELKEQIAEIDAKINPLNAKTERAVAAAEKEVAERKQEKAKVVEEKKQEEAKVTEEAKKEAYVQELKQTKDSSPTDYWSVSEVEAGTEGTVIEVDGGKGFVTPDGDIKGVFKSPESTAKNVADKILQEAVKNGGKMLDNFDNYLTKIYERNGFRVVSRTPFNKEYAPEGWDEAKHGTPDVVAMVYDPNGTMEIEEKSFDEYQDMIDYRDNVLVTEQLGSEIDDFMNSAEPQLQLDSELTPKEKKEELAKQATELMAKVEGEGFTEEAFTAETPAPKVKTHTLVIKDNSKLAKKVKRMGLKELIGKKINLVMADQLKVGNVEVNGKQLPRMGGHMFPLMDALFGKVAWASINKGAARSIINGAINSDYTVVYNMNPTAIDSNLAMLETTIEAIKALPAKVREEAFVGIKDYLQTVKFGKKTDAVHKVARESKNIDELFDAIGNFDVDTKSGILNKILPSKSKTAGTAIGKLLQDNNIDIEDMRDMNIEQFVADLPAGAMTMVLEVQDKAGNKVTKETADEAIMTKEVQDAEGLPSHQNYPVYVRGKAVAILEETVPFWNMFKTSMSSINAKVAGVVKMKQGEGELGITSKAARSHEMRSASMTANQSKKLSEPNTSAYEKFVSLLSRSFPSVEMVTDEKTFNELVDKLGAKKLATKNQKIYGAVYQGKLYLNPSLENFNTPIHEFGHVWLNTAKEASPELYNKGIALVKGSEYAAQVEASPEYKRVIDQMKKEGATEAEVSQYIAEEALASAIGDKGESFVQAAQKKNFKNWLNNLYSFVRKLTGISKYSAEQLQDITLEEFVQGVAVDILSGDKLFRDSQVKKLGESLQLMTEDKKSVSDIIKFARSKGYSDEVIKVALARKGFTSTEVNEAFNKGRKLKKEVDKNVKQKTRVASGQTDTSQKITTTESKLLREKFKNLSRGTKIGADEMRRIKKEFIKEITIKLKEVVKSNIMTTAEASRILSAVNQLNEKNYDRVAPLVEKVFDAIEGKAIKRQIKQAKSSLRKSAKSERNPVNMRELAREALKVNEAYLNESQRERYLNLLNDVQAGFKAATNKGYVMPHEARLLNSLESLNVIAENAKLMVLAENMGVDGSGLSNSELVALLESINVDEHIEGLKEEKQKAAREALEKQAEYSRIALNDVDTSELSEQERKDVRELKNADLSLLSSTDIRDLIKIVDNIVTNQSFASSGNLVSKVRAYTASNEAVGIFSKDELSMVRKSVITDLKGVALIFKKVFMNTKKSAVFNKLSGLGKLSMAYTKHKKAMNALSEAYDKEFKSVKKYLNKSISKPENTMFRGLVGQLIQGSTAEDFAVNKSRIEDHIEISKKAQSSKTRLGIEVLEEQYDRIKHLNSQDEVIEFTKNLDDGNWQLIDFWLKHFENTKEALKYNTEVVHGKSFEEVSQNYLPIKLKADGKATEDVDNLPFFDRNGLPATNASPTTIKRTKTKKLPRNRVLDLDFDSVMFSKASASSIDTETSAAYKDVYNFFKSPNMEKMFGTETLSVFNAKLTEMRKVQLGIASMSVNADEVTKNVTKVERVWKSIATTIGLGSLTQYPKQYISVAFNVAAHLGKQGDLMFFAMFTDKTKIPLLDMVSISLRGETQAGTITAGTRISEAEKRATKAMIGRIAQETGQAADAIRNALFYSLRKGDVNVAKSSWIAFYQKYLIDSGISRDDIDMTTEHEKMDEKLRQEAISYAELKVEETQISSDDSRGSEFYQSKSVDRSILRSMFLPYQSFNINSKMRMMNDLGILGSNRASSEDKREAASSLIGTTAEIAAFHTMKYYVLSQLMMLGKSAVMAAFGLDAPDEDEEDVEKQKDFKFKQWYSALAKDLNPLSIGTFAEDMSIEVLNYLQYLSEGEEDETYMDFIKNSQDDGGQMFYRYKDKEERGQAFGASLLGGGGLYQIPYSQFGEVSTTFELMTTKTSRDSYGNLYQYDFDEKQETFLKVAFAVDVMSLFGLGEADSRRIFSKIRKDMVKETDKEKIN